MAHIDPSEKGRGRLGKEAKRTRRDVLPGRNQIPRGGKFSKTIELTCSEGRVEGPSDNLNF